MFKKHQLAAIFILLGLLPSPAGADYQSGLLISPWFPTLDDQLHWLELEWERLPDIPLKRPFLLNSSENVAGTAVPQPFDEGGQDRVAGRHLGVRQFK